ncbi:MAG: fructosamine kinase family protein [Verrucomicrobia bacterium]|nr:fructosamine kinase family protein [Verrucomicrobiota bacterium]
MILDKSEIGSVLQSAIGLAPPIGCITPVFGGCINRSFKLVDNHGLPYFLKINSNHPFPILKPEFVALSELYKLYMEGTGLRVPKPLWHGKILERECLVLEYIPMSSSASTGSWRQLGNDLARLHKIRGPAFGWHIDNFIGSSPQKKYINSKLGGILDAEPYWQSTFDGAIPRLSVSRAGWIHGKDAGII